MIRTCPFCGKTYVPVLERPPGDNRPIQMVFPDAPAWQREQLTALGCCSDECWRENVLGETVEMVDHRCTFCHELFSAPESDDDTEPVICDRCGHVAEPA